MNIILIQHCSLGAVGIQADAIFVPSNLAPAMFYLAAHHPRWDKHNAYHRVHNAIFEIYLVELNVCSAANRLLPVINLMHVSLGL